LGNVCIASRRGGYTLSTSLFLNHDCSQINKVKLVNLSETRTKGSISKCLVSL